VDQKEVDSRGVVLKPEKYPLDQSKSFGSGNCSCDGQLRVEIFRSVSSLESIKLQWNRLILDTEQVFPMATFAWVVSYFEHMLNRDESWLVIAVCDNDELVGLLPVIHKVSNYGIAKYTEIKTPYDDHVDFVISPGREEEIIPLLLRGLVDEFPGSFALVMTRIPEYSPTLRIVDKCPARFYRYIDFAGKGSYLPIDGKFEDIRSGISSNFRKNLNKARRKLETMPNFAFEFLEGEQASYQHVERLIEVEGSGWKGREGTAIQKSKSLISFYTMVAKRLHEAGWLEWQFLKAGDKTIAGQLSIRIGKVLTVYKIGYDEAYSEVSPGSLLFEATARHACDSGDIETINCLTDMSWHRRWRMPQWSYYNLTIWPRRPLAMIFGVALTYAKDAMRRIPVLRRTLRSVKSAVNGMSDSDSK